MAGQKLPGIAIAATIFLSACSSGEITVPPQVTFEQLAAQNFAYSKYGTTGFRDVSSGQLRKIGAWVESPPADRKALKGRKIYFDVTLDMFGAMSVASSRKLPKAHLDALPDDLLAAAHGAIAQRRSSAKLIELGKAVSKLTLCTYGRPAASDRRGTRVRFTPAQSAQVNSTFGGQPEQVLGKSVSDLRKLGIGGKSERIPVIDYQPGKPGFVDIHMMCRF